MAGARVAHIGGVGRDAKAIPAGRRDAHRRDEAGIPDGCRRGLDAACVTCDDAGARIVYGRIATADTNTTRDSAVIVDRCPRTEHHAETVSRHRRAGRDIVGIVVVVPFWLVVFPVQVTIVLLTGEAGVQAASARPLIAKEAISSTCISACRRGISFGPATYVFARALDFSPTLARANTLKPNLRPIRFKFGRTLEGNLECARQPVG